MKPSAVGEAQEVKVKVRINHNGILLISSAQMIEKKEVEEDAPKPDSANQNGMEGEQPPQSPGEAPTTPGDGAGPEPMEVTEVSSINVDHCILCSLHESHFAFG